MPERRLPDFITSFCEYASSFNTTPNFARAAALWMVALAPFRAVATQTGGNTLYPNLFLQMIGGPGTGKSQAISAAKTVLLKSVKLSLIPASITRAGMEDYMQGNLQQRRRPDGQMIMSNECIGLAEEMQGILPDQDLGHLTLYNILYDNPNLHMAQTRSHGEIRLEEPYCAILAGAQPAYLATVMPEQSWGMGFMSRTMMIFDTPRERRSMFDQRQVDHKLLADLIHDLKQIADLCGWMAWDKDAVKLYDEWWVKAGGQPVPTAKRLTMGYNARRELHFAKLAMVMSLSRSNELRVTLADVQEAIRTMLHFEERMKSIFTEMGNAGSISAIEDVIEVVRTATAEGKAVPESQLINLLLQRIPPTQVHAMVEQLVSGGAIKHVGLVNGKGFREFQLASAGGSLL